MITSVGVKRPAAALLFFSTLGLWAPRYARAADRDIVVFDAVVGGTVSKFSGQSKWQPNVWVDGSYGVAGPLHLGAYFQWLGRSLPLESPGFGGGALLALRKNVKKLRMSGAFGGGYLGVPLPDQVEGTGTISAFGGLGYGFLKWMGIEARGRWQRYFKMPPDAPNHAWSIEAGFSFFVK